MRKLELISFFKKKLNKKIKRLIYNHSLETRNNRSVLTGLPDNIVPLSYNLDIDLDDEKFVFSGTTTIEFKVVKNFDELNFIELNTCDLQVRRAEVLSPEISDEILEAADIQQNIEDQTTKFTFDHNKLKHLTTNFELKVVYTGITGDKNCGFYRSFYTDEESGLDKYQFVTQFEATDARKAFPCYDHPSIKADFQLKLTTKAGFTHLSNMPAKTSTLFLEGDKQRKSTLFEVLKKHTTYLVAFTASELVPIKSQIPFRIPVTTWTLKGYEERSQYSANFTTQCIKFYEELFDIPFPFPKLDSVLCRDFTFEAMENTGMIVYDVNSLLLEPNGKHTIEELRYCSEIISHEVAHQWFGNLVTMNDWTDLWLNEAGATFWSWFCCDNFYPEWKVWDSFVCGSMQLGLNLDCLESTHPIQYKSCTKGQIAQMFDDISYDKGAAMLRMVTLWLGKETLVKGLSSYLKTFMWKNATSEDLWYHLEQASSKPVVEVMTKWTEQPGYPKVTVNHISYDENEVTLELTQTRFFKASKDKSSNGEIYPVILFIRNGDKVEHVILQDKTMILKVKRENNFGIYNLNADHSGFYILKYDEKHFENLIEHQNLLSVKDKVGLISDMIALTTSGDINVAFLIQNIKQWFTEGVESGAYWKQLMFALENIEAVFDNEDISKIFALLIEQKLNDVGYEIKATDSINQKDAKTILFHHAVHYKSPEYFKIALEMFDNFINNKVDIEPLFRDTVLSAAALNGSSTNYNLLFDIYKKGNEYSVGALKALAKFDDLVLMKNTFDHINSKRIYTQDVFDILEAMSTYNPNGSKMMWEWITNSWDSITKEYPPDLKPFQHVIRSCTNGFSKQSEYLEIQQFFKDKDTKGFDMILAQSLETIKYRYEWYSRDINVLHQYLESLTNK